MDAKTTINSFIGSLDAEQIKRALKYGLRAMSDPCGVPGCKAQSPGPACMVCNTPTCMIHTLVRAAEPTRPICPSCIAQEYAAALADAGMLGDEDGSDGRDSASPKRPRRRSRR